MSTWSQADLERAERDFIALQEHLGNLDTAVTLPLPRYTVEWIPWIGERYVALHQLLDMGQSLADAGARAFVLGRAVLVSFESTGISPGANQEAPTWLDSLLAGQDDLRQTAAALDQARTSRAALDESLLPAEVQDKLARVDLLISKYDSRRAVDENLSALASALGADGEVRYLLLFQNPAELRPGGGFAGTLALATFRRGQLTGYQFSPIEPLSHAYNGGRTHKVPLPWPIEQFFFQDGFQIQDATWYADFPRGGAEVMAMYAETGWPPIDGVIAIQPDAVRDVLRITGPAEVEFGGERKIITADNVYEEIERQQRLSYGGQADPDQYKDLLAAVGSAAFARLKEAGRGDLITLGAKLIDASNRRDVQVYVNDQRTRAVLDRLGWTGRIVPDPDTPTLAVTFANLAINKASLKVRPRVNLGLGEAVGSFRNVELTVKLTHTGSDADDPLYGGFQRWWIEVWLPAGSTVVGGTEAQPNPEAPNGGSYVVDLFPGQTGAITILARIPADDELLIRRQPGMPSVALTVSYPSCAVTNESLLTADQRLRLPVLCR